MTNIATYFGQYKYLNVFIIPYKVIASSTFISGKLKTYFHQEPKNILEAFLIFFQYIDIKYRFPWLEVIVANNTNKSSESWSPINVNFVNIEK